MIQWLRDWARTHTEQDRYSPVGIAFHWIMAGLVVFQLGYGWYVSMLPSGGDKYLGYHLHTEVGLLILILAMLRFLWRMVIPAPQFDHDSPPIQDFIARATHWIFYICFFLLPLSGWVMWSALGTNQPLTVGGVLPWPALPFAGLDSATQIWLLESAEVVHHWLILVLAVLIPLHVAAALKHHFWNRHDVLKGMLPEIPDAPATKKPRMPRSG